MGGAGIPGGFVAIVVLIAALGLGSTAWRISTARRIARSNGLDPDDATAVALLDRDGLAATYLGAGLGRGRSAASRSAEERLAEERLAELERPDHRGRAPGDQAAHPRRHLTHPAPRGGLRSGRRPFAARSAVVRSPGLADERPATPLRPDRMMPGPGRGARLPSQGRRRNCRGSSRRHWLGRHWLSAMGRRARATPISRRWRACWRTMR
ncbi:MAG: hypothetical protein ACJ74O_08835 [Frankiaceae bacterium]